MTALLKYHLRTMNFVFLKYTIQWFSEVVQPSPQPNFFILKGNSVPMSSHSSASLPPVPGNHYSIFCFYGTAYISMSTLQMECFCFCIVCFPWVGPSSVLFVFWMYNLWWKLNLFKTPAPPTSLKEIPRTEEHVKLYKRDAIRKIFRIPLQDI